MSLPHGREGLLLPGGGIAGLRQTGDRRDGRDTACDHGGRGGRRGGHAQGQTRTQAQHPRPSRCPSHGPRRLHLGPARQPHLQSPRLPPTTHLCERPWKTRTVTGRTPARSRPRERAALSRGRGGFPVGHAPSGPSSLPPGQACTALPRPARHCSTAAISVHVHSSLRSSERAGRLRETVSGLTQGPRLRQDSLQRARWPREARPSPAQPTSARLGCLRLSQNVQWGESVHWQCHTRRGRRALQTDPLPRAGCHQPLEDRTCLVAWGGSKSRRLPSEVRPALHPHQTPPRLTAQLRVPSAQPPGPDSKKKHHDYFYSPISSPNFCPCSAFGRSGRAVPH